MRESDIDGDAAPLFFFQPVGVGAGERAYERALAMVDVTGCPHNDRFHRTSVADARYVDGAPERVKILAMADELVTIMTFRDLPLALLAQGKLDAEGIESVLADENVVRMDWFWANAMGGIKLRVSAEDADEALQLLNEGIPPSLDVEDERFEQPSCPKCGSLDVRFDAPGRGVQLAALYVGPLPVPAGKQRWICDACDAQWEVLPDDAV